MNDFEHGSCFAISKSDVSQWRGAGAGRDCVCEPEAERERHKQSYEIAGGRRGSKLVLFGTNVL